MSQGTSWYYNCFLLWVCQKGISGYVNIFQGTPRYLPAPELAEKSILYLN
jgi:hypothetical protein